MGGKWTEEDFQRVALSTKLSEKTLAACRDVLVEGKSGVDAAMLHGVLPAQVSRGKKNLEERLQELSANVEKMSNSREAMKEYAIREAKLFAAGLARVEEAVPGGRYEGPGVLSTPGFIVQRVGRDLIVHDLGKLSQTPNLHSRLEIEYPKDGGMASLVEKMERASDKGKGPAR